jgi:hypothetical protein
MLGIMIYDVLYALMVVEASVMRIWFLNKIDC